MLQDQVSINPYERYILTQNEEDIVGKALDAIVPIGMGQRGLIIAPPKSGKTFLLSHMANSVVTNHPDAHVFILLVDERLRKSPIFSGDWSTPMCFTLPQTSRSASI